MKKKIRLSGMSYGQGITFFGDKYDVEWNMDGSYKITKSLSKRENKILKIINKIPFIRGISKIIYLVFQLILISYKKYKIYLLIAILIIFYIIFAPKNEFVSKGIFWDNFLNIIVYFILFYFIYSARENHSIEHKLIGSYENCNNLNLKMIYKQPKENPRCGGVLVAWILVFYGLFLIVFHNFPNNLWSILLISPAYECFLLADNKRLISKVFYMPGWLIQKLTTTNNLKRKYVMSARKAIMALLNKEGCIYKK